MAKTLHIEAHRVVISDRIDIFTAEQDEELLSLESFTECNVIFSDGGKYVFLISSGDVNHPPSISMRFEGDEIYLPMIHIEVIFNTYVISVSKDIDYDICIVRDK